MSVFRELLMANQKSGGVPPADDYIKDGLVLHLDGIDKGSDNSAWTDLIRGIKFIKQNIDDFGNGVSIKGDGNSYLYNYTDDIAFPYQTTTLEFCVNNSRASLRNSVILLYNKHKYDMVYNRYMGSNFYVVEGGKEFANTDNLLYVGNNVISYNKDFCIINKSPKIKPKNGISSPQEGNGIVIGGRIRNGKVDRNYNGVIHSIRIYNRQLTEEEMLHNQQVDIDRFFGGVPPTI